MIPLSLELGAGAEIWSPLAKTVIGGLAFGVIFTLFITPTISVGFKQIINFMFQENTWQHGLFKDQIDHRFKFVKKRLLEEIPIVKELYYYGLNDPEYR